MNWILKAAFAAALCFAAGCVTNSKRPEQVRADDRKKIEAELSEEMSLKADRDHLAEMRKDIPQEVQKANDELALQLNLMKGGTEAPASVRDRFNSLVMRKRSDFRAKVDRLRSDYRAQETRRREDFMQAQKKKRESFLSGKRERAEITRFNTDMEKERVRFNADERDRRQNFEAELNSSSKDFESYMRERQKEFNEQYRLYSKKYSEKPKEKKAVTGDEFRQMDALPAKTIGTED